MSEPKGIKKKSQLTHMDGGTGKGTADNGRTDWKKYGENLDKTKGTRKMKCLDCFHFKGINPIDVVTCNPENNKHKGLEICENNFLDEYEGKK